MFFSYIGFDAASTAGEEARNPKRDLPRAIMLSMLIVTTIYVLVAVAAIGARPWGWFDGTEAALVKILEETTGQPWIALVFAVGAVLAIASIVLTVLYGQTRILLSMSRDGLIPKIFGRVSRRTGTPAAGTLMVGTAVALTAGLVPLGALADATSIGTLFAFALVNVAVIYLRRTRPELERTFRVPLFPLTPILGALMCAYLMANLGADTWVTFGIWMLVGLAAYFGYGRRNSRVAALSHEEYRELSRRRHLPALRPPPNQRRQTFMTIATELPASDPSSTRRSAPASGGQRPHHHAEPGLPVQLRPLPGPPGRAWARSRRSCYGTEVAVVGAGLSGLVTAYELMKLGLRPVVYEADQIGGRLRTASFPVSARAWWPTSAACGSPSPARPSTTTWTCWGWTPRISPTRWRPPPPAR